MLVVYLRNQLSYLESLFPQILNHGFAQEYRQCAETILETGSLRINEWQFLFDYRKLLELWKPVANISMIVRSYHNLTDNSIIADFAQALGIEPTLLQDVRRERVNTRGSVARSLAQFYQNRSEQNLTPIEAARIGHLCRNLPPDLCSGLSLHRAFAQRFNNGNMDVYTSENLPPKSLAISKPVSARHSVELEQLFSFETQCAIRFGTVKEPGSAMPPDFADLPFAGIEGVKPILLNPKKKMKYFFGRFLKDFGLLDLNLLDIA